MRPSVDPPAVADQPATHELTPLLAICTRLLKELKKPGTRGAGSPSLSKVTPLEKAASAPLTDGLTM